MLDTIMFYVRVVIPTAFERVVLAIGAMVGTWISLGVGGFDDSFIVLCLFMLADIITGSIAAWKKGDFSTKVSSIGFFKKGFIIFMVMLCNGVDEGLHVQFMRDACIMAYILNEAMSNVENIDRMGFGHLIPPFIRKGLAQIREQKKQQIEGKLGIKEGDGNESGS